MSTPSSAYSTGKGGIHALTKNLALELAPYQIRVNSTAASWQDATDHRKPPG
jgi:NAD(P)-dependent dehydrogenase (short-subunit alcohol dehydrogenase family)